MALKGLDHERMMVRLQSELQLESVKNREQRPVSLIRIAEDENGLVGGGGWGGLWLCQH
jgi:hypothetical protein